MKIVHWTYDSDSDGDTVYPDSDYWTLFSFFQI